jgi:hypothetical protein
MHPISRYPVPSLEDLPADIRERIVNVHEKSGFIPNVFPLLRAATSSARSSPITTRSWTSPAVSRKPSAR